MNPALLLSPLVTLLQDAPELASVVQQDINDLSNNTITPEQVLARWQAMQQAWSAAKTKWIAAATPLPTNS